VAPQYGALVFALVTGPALLAGLVFGTGTALLLEYVARCRRGSVYGVSASQAQGAVGQDAHQTRATEAEPWATFHRGSVFDRQGEYDLAVEAYQQVIASGHPEAAPRAAFDLGVLFEERGEYDRAEEAYQQAIDSGHPEEAPRAAFNLGLMLDKQGKYARAEEAYQQAIDSRHPEVAPKAVGNLRGLPMRLIARESSDKEASES
jgi:tetratricopeptide (TPR) repeat protein